jgi:hypothetical protein
MILLRPVGLRRPGPPTLKLRRSGGCSFYRSSVFPVSSVVTRSWALRTNRHFDSHNGLIEGSLMRLRLRFQAGVEFRRDVFESDRRHLGSILC